MDAYQPKFVGVHLPIELVKASLKERHIALEEIAEVHEEAGMFYKLHGKMVSAKDKFHYLPDGTGTIGYYLKLKDHPLSVSEASAKVEFMLMSGTGREKLYTMFKVVFKNERELNPPLCVFTAVAELRQLP